jgi:hypothetical protein
MKYEKPELTALTSAINAIQSVHKSSNTPYDNPITDKFDSNAAYQDWES